MRNVPIYLLYAGPPLRYIPPPMIRLTIKKTHKTKPSRALGVCA